MADYLIPMGLLFAAFAGMVCFTGYFQRSPNHGWVHVVIAAYGAALSALFFAGFLMDVRWQAEGWGYLPMMALCAPWSFLVPIQAHNFLFDWFASSLFGNFVLFVVVCGGINASIFYFATRLLGYPKSQTVVSTEL